MKTKSNADMLNETLDMNAMLMFEVLALRQKLDQAEMAERVKQLLTMNVLEELVKARAEERERCAKFIEGGNFLSSDSPEAIVAKRAAKAIRSLGNEE